MSGAPSIARAQLSRLRKDLAREHRGDIAALLDMIADERHELVVLDLYLEALAKRRAALAPCVVSTFGAAATTATPALVDMSPPPWLVATARVAAAHGVDVEALIGPLGPCGLARVRWALWADLMADRRADGSPRYTLSELARRFRVDGGTVRHGLRRQEAFSAKAQGCAA